MKKFFVLAALLSVGAQAQTLGVHLVSHHNPAAEFNNVNPGLYYRSADGWTGGIYRNSESRWTIYGGYTLQADLSGWKPALTIGGMYGYREGDCRSVKPMAWAGQSQPEKCRTRVLPMLLPSLGTPDVAGWRLRLAYMPRIKDRGAEVLHLMVEKDL
ncbi:hypothetical protein M8A51_23480 [Schlegelella sp. S2-27]|uniref:Uncharacterized protein n=1 Tax=Caldimonas mangrovi TaxID=2944811 RepID=A0ABT0YW18_9BURK|nr:hypothetical protein [Caldimonas mangrovi]MCM5682502.1 hypothetical protein [Caldimonas mangrovi]